MSEYRQVQKLTSSGWKDVGDPVLEHDVGKAMRLAQANDRARRILVEYRAVYVRG